MSLCRKTNDKTSDVPRDNPTKAISAPVDMVAGQTREDITQVSVIMLEPRARRDEVVKLRETGLTYAEIGGRFGISKERVRQILKGNSTAQKPDLHSKIMLTTTDVAQLLGVHLNTVRRWNEKGILKSYRIGPRGDRRFKREDIDSFLKEAEIE